MHSCIRVLTSFLQDGNFKLSCQSPVHIISFLTSTLKKIIVILFCLCKVFTLEDKTTYVFLKGEPKSGTTFLEAALYYSLDTGLKGRAIINAKSRSASWTSMFDGRPLVMEDLTHTKHQLYDEYGFDMNDTCVKFRPALSW